ncbi:MAG: hypothetical protein ABIR24_09435 [Verrucomicrobiota bacterium]
MDDASEEKRAAEILAPETRLANAWQPFTPLGVAAFVHAPLARVVVLQFIVAFVAATVLVWFLNANYSPSILEAIQNLPDETTLKQGQLTNVASQVLTEKKFLSIIIDLEETGESGRVADLQVELRKNYFQICSVLGCGIFDYPKETISIGRSTSEPWWGARQPVILAMCGALTFVGVWLSWSMLALIYAPMAKLIAYFTDRELSWRGSWRLACAAQMMGALLMCLAIVLYGLQAFDLIRFMFFFSLHFVVTWFYIFSAPRFLPRVSAAEPVAMNPFM